MTETKVATTWLQCVMPKADWDKLNARRLKIDLKWSELLPTAAERMLGLVEKGDIKADRLRKSPAVEKAPEPATKKEEKKGSKKAPKVEEVAAPAETTADPLKAKSKKKKAQAEPVAPAEAPAADTAELASLS